MFFIRIGLVCEHVIWGARPRGTVDLTVLLAGHAEPAGSAGERPCRLAFACCWRCLGDECMECLEVGEYGRRHAAVGVDVDVLSVVALVSEWSALAGGVEFLAEALIDPDVESVHHHRNLASTA